MVVVLVGPKAPSSGGLSSSVHLGFSQFVTAEALESKGSHARVHYISHSNIHGISTWKGPTQTQCGKFT